MPRSFDVPNFYRSSIIGRVKAERARKDPKKKDLSPSVVDRGRLRIKLARHFGFCFGVENAIEIAYKAIRENPDRRIFLLSEMIHNPEVNADLIARGVRFLMSTQGERLLDFSELSAEDIVIVPAFGTTLELQKELSEIGIDPYYYDTTCPFVEKVWKRAAQLGEAEHTVIIHGKRTHEETRATFSHSKVAGPTLIIFNVEDAEFLAAFIKSGKTSREFKERFCYSMSEGFEPEKHLQRLGVVNQTTMLASETKQIAKILRDSLVDRYGAQNIDQHFADTRDTLCYATYENQTATKALIDSGADLAIVVGGYNSSNTSHLVELCQEKFPTYYIKDAAEITNACEIRHFDLPSGQLVHSKNWLARHLSRERVEIAVTSGASCPDKTVEEVIEKISALCQLQHPRQGIAETEKAAELGGQP